MSDNSLQLFKGIISNPHVQVHENGSLIITESMTSDAAYYLCQAHNGVSSGLSKLVKLDVYGKKYNCVQQRERVI